MGESEILLLVSKLKAIIAEKQGMKTLHILKFSILSLNTNGSLLGLIYMILVLHCSLCSAKNRISTQGMISVIIIISNLTWLLSLKILWIFSTYIHQFSETTYSLKLLLMRYQCAYRSPTSHYSLWYDNSYISHIARKKWKFSCKLVFSEYFSVYFCILKCEFLENYPEFQSFAQ